MSAAVDVAAVFPAAHLRGGVERIAVDVLSHLAAHHSTGFVGEELDRGALPHVQFSRVEVAPGPSALRPARFRRAAAQVVQRNRPRCLLSFGAVCPPGDVYWVQSVHQAWVNSGSSVRVKGVRVPNRARRLLPRHQVLLRLENEYFRHGRPRAILCTSQREVRDLQEYYDVDPSLLLAVPNGYDAARFTPAVRATHRTEMRARMGMTDGQVSLLFVVNELHRKGFAVLLDAVARTGDERLRIDIVGKMAPDAYAGQIERLGLQERVRWHGPTAEVERYMAAGDLLVLPTQYEPFGLVVVEAMATGLPALTTRLAGAADAVQPDVNGVLQSDPHDADELAALLQQASRPGTLERWSAAAAESVKGYAWHAIMQRVEPILLPS